jgi:hypothetical protein
MDIQDTLNFDPLVLLACIFLFLAVAYLFDFFGLKLTEFSLLGIKVEPENFIPKNKYIKISYILLGFIFPLLVCQHKDHFTEIIYEEEVLFLVKEQFIANEKDRHPTPVPADGLKLFVTESATCIDSLLVEFDVASYADGRLSGSLEIYVDNKKMETIKPKTKIDWKTFSDLSQYHHVSINIPISDRVSNIFIHIDTGDYALSLRNLRALTSYTNEDRLLYFYIKRLFCSIS